MGIAREAGGFLEAAAASLRASLMLRPLHAGTLRKYAGLLPRLGGSADDIAKCDTILSSFSGGRPLGYMFDETDQLCILKNDGVVC